MGVSWLDGHGGFRCERRRDHDISNSATKYVATRRPESIAWGPVKDLGADAIEGIHRLKSQNGPDLMVCGSASLTSVLLEQGLVDEVVLAVYPILLGRGKRCFPDGTDPRELALVSSTATPSGVLINSYRYVGAWRPNRIGRRWNSRKQSHQRHLLQPRHRDSFHL